MFVSFSEDVVVHYKFLLTQSHPRYVHYHFTSEVNRANLLVHQNQIALANWTLYKKLFYLSSESHHKKGLAFRFCKHFSSNRCVNMFCIEWNFADFYIFVGRFLRLCFVIVKRRASEYGLYAKECSLDISVILRIRLKTFLNPHY